MRGNHEELGLGNSSNLAFLRAILSGEIRAVLEVRAVDLEAEGKETVAVTAAAMAAEGEKKEEEGLVEIVSEMRE